MPTGLSDQPLDTPHGRGYWQSVETCSWGEVGPLPHHSPQLAVVWRNSHGHCYKSTPLSELLSLFSGIFAP